MQDDSRACRSLLYREHSVQYHPEKIVDVGQRAVHVTAVTAKAIVRAFYGEDPRRSYFSSCYNGGRQALMEAQRYPGGYDGMVAGAPANYWTALLSFAASNAKATLAEAASYIPAAKLPAIEAAALAACDASDGVKDGVIENPPACPVRSRGVLVQERGIGLVKGSARPGADVVRTRPLCPYPLIAEYKGTGSTDEAANFTCATR
jgi:hypothetical protein